MPGRQLLIFVWFFNVVVFWAFAVTLYLHFHQAKVLGRADAVLVGIVLIQFLLYFCFMVFPFITAWPASRWFRESSRKCRQTQSRKPSSRPALVVAVFRGKHGVGAGRVPD